MNRLKQIRQENGISLRKLAAAAQVDQSTISEIENDKRKAQQITLTRLAVALNVPLQEFNNLVDTTASQRGLAASQARGLKRKQIQAPSISKEAPDQPLAASRSPAQPGRRRASQPRPDCWVFDTETESYGPFTLIQAEKIKAKINKLGGQACIFQGENFLAVSEDFRKFLYEVQRNQAFWT